MAKTAHPNARIPRSQAKATAGRFCKAKNSVTDIIPDIIPAFPPEISITVAPKKAKPTSQVLLRRELRVKAKRSSVPADMTKPFGEPLRRPSSKAVEGCAKARATGNKVIMTKAQKVDQKKPSISFRSRMVLEQNRRTRTTSKSLDAQASE